MRATWAAVGNAPRRAQQLLTTAAMVGAVNALVVGLAVTLLAGLAGLSSGFAIGVGTVLALLAFAAQVAYINRESITQPGRGYPGCGARRLPPRRPGERDDDPPADRPEQGNRDDN